MKKLLMISLACAMLSNSTFAQDSDAYTDKLRDRALSVAAFLTSASDMVDVVLLVDNLVMQSTYVIERTELCQQKLDALKVALEKGPVQNHCLSASQSKDWVSEVQFYNANVRIYGRAAKSMLTSIKRAMASYQRANNQRNGVDDVEKDIISATKEFLFDYVLTALRDDPYTSAVGMGHAADMTPVKEHLKEDMKRDGAYADLDLWKAQLRRYVEHVMRLSNQINIINGKLDMMTHALNGSVGMMVVCLMNMTGGIADGVAATNDKKYELFKNWKENDAAEQARLDKEISELNKQIYSSFSLAVGQAQADANAQSKELSQKYLKADEIKKSVGGH